MAADTSYRPQLLFLTFLAPKAFATNAATTDTSILVGSISGGGYGPDQARYDEPAMQECVQTLADAGIETPSPAEVGDDPSNQPFQAAFQACPDVALLRALLEAAGEELNYGTLDAAIDGLQLVIPGDPAERTYGPPRTPTVLPPSTSTTGTRPTRTSCSRSHDRAAAHRHRGVVVL